MLAIETQVCGCNFGGNGWTTKTQADDLIKHLQLRSGQRLLDLGAGSGWPALYFVINTGCDAVLVDLPKAGLRIAEERADKEGISSKIKTVAADASELPFDAGTFDAISHTDLLCCLERKRAVLACCRKVIRPAGRMAFVAISVAQGLSQSQQRRAIFNGPTFVESDQDYPTMLDETGWLISKYFDISKSYANLLSAQIRAETDHEEGLADLVGRADYEQRIAGWRGEFEAVRDGLLLRELFVAEPSAG